MEHFISVFIKQLKKIRTLKSDKIVQCVQQTVCFNLLIIRKLRIIKHQRQHNTMNPPMNSALISASSSGLMEGMGVLGACSSSPGPLSLVLGTSPLYRLLTTLATSGATSYRFSIRFSIVMCLNISISNFWGYDRSSPVTSASDLQTI